jgi:hypothetical protein
MRNDGNLNFTEIQLSTQPYSSTWAMIIDLDQDQDHDILGTNFMATGGILWYEQTALMTFTEHLIPFPWAHGGAIGDIDGDGDIDLAGASCGSSVKWFENNGNNEFTPHLVNAAFGCSVSVEIGDVNADGEADIVGEAWSANKIAWWENDGEQNFFMHVICDSLIHPSGLALANLNQDVLPDVIAGSYSNLLDWFENNGTGTGMPEPEQNISVDLKVDPGSGILLVRFLQGNTEPVTVRLTDTLGRTGYSAVTRDSEMVIPVQHLPRGIYLIVIQSSLQRFSSKIRID